MTTFYLNPDCIHFKPGITLEVLGPSNYTHSNMWEVLQLSLEDKINETFQSKLLELKNFKEGAYTYTFVYHPDLGYMGRFRGFLYEPFEHRVTAEAFRKRSKEDIKVQGRKHGLEFVDIEFTWTCGCTVMDSTGQLWEHDWSHGGGGNLTKIY